MNGMDRKTGKALSGIAHLKQSITDILTTPIGSRVMLRDYGSRLFGLVDQPITSSLLIDIYSATAEALAIWEPNFELMNVSASRVEQGHINIHLVGKYLIDGKTITLDGIVL